MFFKKYLLLFLLLFVYKGEEPQKICDPVTPFKKKDQTCGSFTDICVKTNDEDCDYFQKTCKQCPPTNYTVLMLSDVRSQISRSNIILDWIKNQINILNSRKNEAIVIACLIFIILNFIFVVFHFIMYLLEITKYGRRLFRNIRRRNSSNEDARRLLNNNQQDNENARRLLDNIQQTVQQDNENTRRLLDNIQQTVQQDNTKLHKDVKKMINEKECSALDAVVSHKLRFQIAHKFDETELFVSKFDNVIKLKKSICDRNMNMDDYKRMIMKYKGVTLDNNQYLLSCIDSTNIPIFCEFDNNVDVDFNSATIEIKLKCDNIYPEMLQIQKHQQIKDLKNIISELNKTNPKDLLIFYKSTQLDDDKTIDDYEIEDNDWIQVVNKFGQTQNITMKSIFTDKETISIEISKFETVSDIINKCIQKKQQEIATNHFAVFLNNKLLQNDKFIYEYNIDSKSLVEFCYFKRADAIQDLVFTIDFDHIIMYTAKNKITERPVLIKAYKKEYMDINSDDDLSKVLREDLQLFQITKSHPRFIQLFDIYLGTDVVYIELENLERGLMKSYLSSIEDKAIPIYEISKWAYQILGGLKYLHSHGVILKDMNPMDIWIDGNLDIKLPSFNMTQFLNHLDDDNNKSKYGVLNYKPGILTYVAPEILEGKLYEGSVDVWSLGVIMIYIITRGQLYSGYRESEIVRKIKKSRTIKYEKTKINQPEYLFNFIDCCVKGDPKERPTIDQLMKMEFIEKYLLFHKFY